MNALVPIPSEQRRLDALLRTDLVAFTERVFRELHPGKVMVAGWHHEAIAFGVDLIVGRRQLDRLVVNLPPRSLKSIMLSVALPAFMLGRDPTRQIIVVSYNQDLADYLSRLTRQVMLAPWFRRLFPWTVLEGRAPVGQFFTLMGGFRAALSTGGTFTGKSGDFIIVDDPLKADDAYSETARAALQRWCRTTLFSRLNDKVNGAILVVQQRQHEDDLSGYMLKQPGCYHLNLPAIAEQDERICLSYEQQRFHERKVGDLLDPVREPQWVLDRLRSDMGFNAFQAQYQQAPVPEDGDIIKVGWFQFYDELPEGERTILSIDTALKGGQMNDWSVAMLWHVVGKNYYLDFVWRQKAEFPELLRVIKEMNSDFRPDTVLIEDKGSGISILQTLRSEEPGMPLTPYDPGSVDKKARMQVQAYKIQDGRVFLPRQTPWLPAFFDEVRRFPNGRHDDQIDAMSQFLDHVSRRTVGDLVVLR